MNPKELRDHGAAVTARIVRGLRARRVGLGLTQKQAARGMGISQSSISDIENATHGTALSTVIAYARYLGMGVRFHEYEEGSEMAQRSFTFASPEGVDAVIGAMTSLFERHAMRIGHDDFEAMMRALAEAWNGECAERPETFNASDHYPGGACRESCWRIRAGQLAASIAGSYDIEWV